MTKEVLEFIAEYKLNPQHFFNANGQILTTEIKDQMRSEEKIFAFNTSTCGNGHTIKSRSGHCIVCEPKNIHFTLIKFNEGFVYIAGSIKGSVIKIGSSNIPRCHGGIFYLGQFYGFFGGTFISQNKNRLVVGFDLD